MQELLESIQIEIPNITEKKLFKLLCAMKWRNEQYSKFWLWKRDGPKFWISERQMRKLVTLLLDYWYMTIGGHVKGSRWFKCRIFRASSVLKDILQSVRQGLNGICKSVWNLSDRIRAFNSSHNTFNYLKGQWVVKYNKMIIWDRYIVYNKWKYKDSVYDSQDNKKLTLFEYLRWDANILEHCKNLKLIG